MWDSRIRIVIAFLRSNDCETQELAGKHSGLFSTEVTRSGVLFWQSKLGTMWEMEQPDTRRPGRRQPSQRTAWGNHTERKEARRNTA